MKILFVFLSFSLFDTSGFKNWAIPLMVFFEVMENSTKIHICNLASKTWCFQEFDNYNVFTWLSGSWRKKANVWKNMYSTCKEI